MKCRNKRLTIFILLITISPSIIFAAEIYGTLKDRRKKPIAGAQVQITFTKNKKTYTYSGATNKRGEYNIYVRRRGKCILTVFIGKEDKSASVGIHSFKTSVRYDLIFFQQKGVYQLKVR